MSEEKKHWTEVAIESTKPLGLPEDDDEFVGREHQFFDADRKCLRHGEIVCPSCLTYENNGLRRDLAAAKAEIERLKAEEAQRDEWQETSDAYRRAERAEQERDWLAERRDEMQAEAGEWQRRCELAEQKLDAAQAEAAAMRLALEHVQARPREHGAVPCEIIGEALDGTAGREMLERLRALEDVERAARLYMAEGEYGLFHIAGCEGLNGGPCACGFDALRAALERAGRGG